MKYNSNGLILLIVIFSVTLTCAQSTNLDFSASFYFEDGIGNKDTVTLRFSAAASPISNPDLGEIDLARVPFDSSLEVRVGRNIYVDDSPYFGKTVALPVTSGSVCLGIGADPFFIFHNAHPPLKISWDTTLWIDPAKFGCLISPHLHNTQLEQLIGPWWSPGIEEIYNIDLICLREEGSYTFNPDRQSWQGEFGAGTYFLAEVAGSSRAKDTLDVFILSTSFLGQDGCNLTVNTTEPSWQASRDLRIFPNPAEEKIILNTDFSPSQIRETCVVNAAGVRCFATQGLPREITLAEWPAGLYFVVVVTVNGNKLTQKIVKR